MIIIRKDDIDPSNGTAPKNYRPITCLPMRKY